ncbi:unnamed protein product [Victoria cruziana]
MEGKHPIEVENCRGLVRVFSDGSVHRADDPQRGAPLKDDGSVIWKDYTFDHSLSLQLRIYRPSSIAVDEKIPIYVHFFGGGFCYGSRTWTRIHNYCHHLASALHVVVIAPDYRLAPENPLPAAIDDAFTAIKWVQSQFQFEGSDFCLVNFADPRSLYISGDSSGGNICHHLAVGLATQEILPLYVRGYILITPAFGGERRTPSELTGPLDRIDSTEIFDICWRLALPRGSTRDHPLANPIGPNSFDLSLVKFQPMLVVVAGLDPMRDRQMAYGHALQSMGKTVEIVTFEDQRHSFIYFDMSPLAKNELIARIIRFIAATGGKVGKPRSQL